MKMTKQTKPNRGFWSWILGSGWYGAGGQG